MGLKTVVASALVAGVLVVAPSSAEPGNLKVLAREAIPVDVFADENPGATHQVASGGVVVTSSADALVEKAPNTNLLLSAGSKTTPTHVYYLKRGRLDVSIPQAQVSKIAVLVIGPGGISGVIKGGHAVAQASPGKVSYTALGHEMLVGKGSRWRALAPGQTRAVDLAGQTSKDSEVPGAPELKLTSALSLVLPGSGFTTGIAVKPTKNAVRYQIALLKREAATLTIVDQTTTKASSAQLRGAVPGEYFVVARALDAHGIAGPASPPTAVRVMGIELPQGAELIDHTVVLRQSQRVPLLGVSGLKMTYGNGGYFVDAPDSVGLGRETATTVRFVEPQTKSEVHLSLAPYIRNAKLQIGPTRARWPKDQVTVKLHIEDGSGRTVPPPEKLQTVVSVNLEAVAVHWQRQGNTLSCVIPQPKQVSGPWVVRVEVANELGESIGRDFLEVASSASPPKTQ